MNRAEHNPSSFAAHEAFGRIPSNLRTPEKQRASASVTADLFPPVALAEAPSHAALCAESPRAPRPCLSAASVKAQGSTRAQYPRPTETPHGLTVVAELAPLTQTYGAAPQTFEGPQPAPVRTSLDHPLDAA